MIAQQPEAEAVEQNSRTLILHKPCLIVSGVFSVAIDFKCKIEHLLGYDFTSSLTVLSLHELMKIHTLFQYITVLIL